MRLIATMVACLLVVGTVSTGGLAQGRFDWRQAEGTELRVLALRAWFTDLFKERLPEFERRTGMKVIIEDLPEDPFRQKLAVELAAASRRVDVFNTGTSYEGRRFATSGWYADLTPLLRDPTATSAEWGGADFMDSVWKAQEFDGRHVAVPLQVVSQVLFYRKDLFDAAGLRPPRTLDELEEAARRLHRPPDVYGFVSRGRKTQAPYSWAHFLYGHGGSWIAPDGRTAVASPAAVAALTQYARILRNFGDPGVLDAGPIEVQTLFAQGRAAMILDAGSWAGIFGDPNRSRVFGRWAVAPAPAGPAGVTYELWAWSLALSPFSEKKRAAWLFIQWATSREMQRILHARGFPMPRSSLWAEPAWRTTMEPTWLDAMLLQLRSARPIGHPPVVATAEVVDLVGTAISGALAGRDARAELEAASRRINDVLERTEPKRR
ncbi:MAG: sugar ABC transporter substrate-binding protein [Armatimonadota bacterium]|nr:sugar ABC transporter substrate-binding protein [Armatimonadota bacterium]MDR7483684.1 sugar ABC transporter substrate-binding protein [Armatimonadota bacterium]